MLDYGDVIPQAGNPESVRGTGSARVRPLTGRALAADKQLTTLGGLLMGWSMRESTGSAAAVVELYDGNGTGGQLLGTQQLASAASFTVTLFDDGIEVENGVTAHIVSGSADVVVYFRADVGPGG